MASTFSGFGHLKDELATQLLRPQLLQDPGVPRYHFGDSEDGISPVADVVGVSKNAVYAPDWHWPFSPEDWESLSSDDQMVVKEAYIDFRHFYELGQKYVSLLNNRCEQLFDNKNIDRENPPGTQQHVLLRIPSDDRMRSENLRTIPICSQVCADAYDTALRDHFAAVHAQFRHFVRDHVDPPSTDAWLYPQKVVKTLAAQRIDRFYSAKIAQAKASYRMWFDACQDAKSTWNALKVQFGDDLEGDTPVWASHEVKRKRVPSPPLEQISGNAAS